MKLTAVTDNGITDIERIFHPKTEEYTFFSVPHSTCYKVHHPFDHKQKLELIQENWNNLMHPIRSLWAKAGLQ